MEKPGPKRKCVLVSVCAILILNALVAAVGMATASTHTHQQGENSHHVHGTMVHQPVFEVASDNMDCCETPSNEFCDAHDACKTHCSQPVPSIVRQHHVQLYLSYKIDLATADDEASVEPTKRFKPPRLV